MQKEQSEKERLFDKVVEFVNSLDDYAHDPYNFGVFLTDIERGFAEWLFQDRQQAIDQAVAKANFELTYRLLLGNGGTLFVPKAKLEVPLTEYQISTHESPDPAMPGVVYQLEPTHDLRMERQGES